MKYRATIKEVKSGYADLVRIYYNDAQFLLAPFAPEAYTCGVYGWNADIYGDIIPGVAFVTGYRPFGDIKQNYNVLKKYNDKAKVLQEQYYKCICTREEWERECKNLLEDFYYYNQKKH